MNFNSVQRKKDQRIFLGFVRQNEKQISKLEKQALCSENWLKRIALGKLVTLQTEKPSSVFMVFSTGRLKPTSAHEEEEEHKLKEIGVLEIIEGWENLKYRHKSARKREEKSDKNKGNRGHESSV